MTYTINEIKEKVKPIADKYDVKEMYLFGSYARNEADERSDLDFAVQERGTKLVGSEFMTFQFELEDIFNLSVDLMSLDCAYKSPTMFENRFTPKFEEEKVPLL